MAQPTQPTRSAWRGAFTMWWKESAVLALMSATAVFVRRSVRHVVAGAR